ncbi:proton transporter [Legionella geestiana]|uniref:Proton transporter n=1 Tax=Legionella geestiana TaxID=45065 RepID=A0A0W0U5W6_9GAMM|nr:exopolysaccharide biosynthesis protein [Legionella geestiana]KTD03052.1 proton transporter [Legionella geestiana]QBS12296.1 exopolysaccharide biosynthesis protein [Legionella geestiana]STX52963.1 ABC transporter permease [Legionella geestiana]
MSHGNASRTRMPMSRLLRQFLKRQPKDETLQFGALIQALGEQAYGMLLVVFALPPLLPISAIPGVSFVFGLPVVVIALHLVIGRKSLWLPQKLAHQGIAVDKLLKMVNYATPLLRRIERLLKPRWSLLTRWWVERLLGILLLVLSLLLLLPIPFSNMILAGTIVLMGLGFSERDGLVLALASLTGLGYIGFLSTVASGVWALF